MLVLTRKLQQQIKIGEQITVTILRVKGNTVRVGITAPREVRVIRGELPKLGEAAESSEPAQTVEATADVPLNSIENEEDSAEPAACATVAMPAAAHLPLRKIANRHGGAPLKRLMAACTTLAK
jgi:carbon storage regulator CsrA